MAKFIFNYKEETLGSDLSHDKCVTLLTNSVKKGNFVDSILSQYIKKGKLSESQFYWLHKLANDIKNQCAKSADNIGNVDAFLSYFNIAKERLKHPKLHLIYDEGCIVRFSLAGERSKYPGSIFVAERTKGFSTADYFGRIMPNGDFYRGRDCDAEMYEWITTLVKNLQDEALLFGQETGHCSFCYKELTDERSLKVGYGPVCAKNWGLDWGDLKWVELELDEDTCSHGNSSHASCSDCDEDHDDKFFEEIDIKYPKKPTMDEIRESCGEPK